MFMLDFINLGSSFKKYFEVMPATTQAHREIAYRIRHRVYCEELGYEPIRADGMEHDEHDPHALHVLIRSVITGDFIGTVRLIRPHPEHMDEPLPLENACADTINRELVDPAKLPRDRIAEVSRLAVLPEYRRRKGEGHSPVTLSDRDFGTPTQPRFPFLTAGLYLGMIALAQSKRIDTLFTLTEPRLARHLGALGVRIRQIGGPIEHRGTRVPSSLHVQGVIDGLSFFVRPLYEVIQQDMAANRTASSLSQTDQL